MSELPISAVLKLLSGLGPECSLAPELAIRHITDDSRQVRPGSLFVARVGERVDGRQFVARALEAGAVAILCEKSLAEGVPAVIAVEGVMQAYGLVAHALLGDPASALTVIGVTGTNGKTTTAVLLDGALTHLGRKVARLGTLGFFVAGEKLADTLTTSMPDALAAHLALARAQGATHVVMEVSSHALEQGRIYGVPIAAAGFTNLSQDHLDYHGTMEKYGAAKERLFSRHSPGASVINLDDEFGRSLFQRATSEGYGGQLVGVSALPSQESRLSASRIELTAAGISAVLSFDGREVPLRSPLVGQHNLENLLVALGLMIAIGEDPAAAASALGDVSHAPGRLEQVSGPTDDIAVFVDYAHTPDALERALLALARVGAAHLVCVFGCGGDRDRSKRPLMGEIADRLADVVWITSDNPRSEDPDAILAEIRAGVRRRQPMVEPERRRAISQAISEAPPGSTILIAGKGHEDYQIIGATRLSFDDRVEARQALTLRRRPKGGR